MREQDRLRPYVPSFTVDWLRSRPGVRHRPVEGSLAFVDISGFTRLTERLAARGKVGAEEMSDLLDRTFDALLAVAYAHGAWLVKWGGDAVLLLFQDDGHAARACTAAIEMRRTMEVVGRLETSCGRVRLRVSTGVHSDRFDVFLVGGSHHELVITGPGSTATALAEGAASAGEVVVTAATAALLPPGLVRQRPDGLLLLTRSPGSTPQPLRPAASITGVDLGSCLAEPTRRHLLDGSDDAEHRLVAVAFVEFSGVDALLREQGPGATTAAVDAVVRSCQDACTRHGVSFWETDISKDGGKVMLVAGAPGSNGDEEDALLAVAREVVEADGPLRVRVGVNSGRVFFGQFGPSYRRTMSVKGDAVNLAARLCARAEPGQVLAAATVVGRARTSFAVQALEPFPVKGKVEPIYACVVGPPSAGAGAVGDDVPLLGRAGEQAHLEDLWRRARAGGLQVCDLVGEAGIGRSRLVRELVRSVDGRTVQVRCDRWTATTAYLPVRRLLRDLMDLPQDAAPQVVGDRLLTVLPRELRPWAPLLGVVLDAKVPPTPEAAALDDRFRLARQEQVTVALLLRLLPGPTLLVVDDAHLLDPASAAVLDRLPEQAAAAPWLLVRCLRDDRAGLGPGRLLLPPLDAGTALELLHLLTDAHPLSAHEAALVVERSGGNPLFLTELAATARPGAVTELPSSVEGVVAARIDRLATADRRLLRAAAVLGLEVDRDLLAALGERIGLAVTDDALARLSTFLVPETARRSRFRQAVVQETAYEGLPYSRRALLHGAVGDLLAARAGERVEEAAAQLSLHFSRAARHDEAWHHARVAAARASAAGAHAEAAELHARALSAARALELGTELAEAWEGLGDARFRLAQFAAAADAFGNARRQLAGQPLDSARLRHKTALCAERSGSYTQALRWASSARTALGAVPDGTQAQRLSAETLVVRATVRHWQGRHGDAARDCRSAVALATSAGALDVVAEALVWLDVSELMLGRGDGAHAREALAVLRRLGDRPWQLGRCLNELGMRAWYANDWAGARQAYEQCRAAFSTAGDAWAASLAQANEAEILLEQGHLAQAEPHLRSALRSGRASAAPGHTAFVLALLASLEVRTGRPVEALEHVAEALRLYEEIGEPEEASEARLRLAECRLLAGDARGALADLDTLGAVDRSPLLLRVRGLALAMSGEQEPALAALEESIAVGRAAGSDHDLALGLAALAWWQAQQGLAVPAGADAEQATLRERLGIVAITLPAQPPRAVDLRTPEQRTAR